MTDSTDRAWRLSFSSHRGGARHHVRYVEGSAPPAGECRLCVGSLADRPSHAPTFHPVAVQLLSPRYRDWFSVGESAP